MLGRGIAIAAAERWKRTGFRLEGLWYKSNGVGLGCEDQVDVVPKPDEGRSSRPGVHGYRLASAWSVVGRGPEGSMGLTSTV